METSICSHDEIVEDLAVVGGELHAGVCSICGQVRRFEGPYDDDVITKLGRIDGKIVMPLAGQKLVGLTPEETRIVRAGFDTQQETKEEVKFQEKMGRAKRQKEEFEEAAETAPGELHEIVNEEREAEMTEPGEFIVPDLSDMAMQTKGRFYLLHRDEILSDLATMGREKMRVKWQISDSGWHGMKSRWRKQGIAIEDELTAPSWYGRKPEKKGGARTGSGPKAEPKVPTRPANPGPSGLPPFPSFDSSWPMLTQIEWIKAYKEMREGKFNVATI
ncbi:MAG: hypothetical protein Q8P12_02580 [bacterium]|nr:hypothetical protein [bacterium]